MSKKPGFEYSSPGFSLFKIKTGFSLLLHMKFFILLTQMCLTSAFCQSNFFDCSSLEKFRSMYSIQTNKIDFIKKIVPENLSVNACEYEFFSILSSFTNQAYNDGEYELFKTCSQLLWHLSLTYSNKDYLPLAGFNLGTCFMEESIYDSSYYYFNEAVLGYKKNGDSLKVGENLLNMSIIRLNTGSYYESQKLSIQALLFMESLNEKNTNQLLSAYNNLGISSNELAQYKEAILWYKKAFALCREPIEKVVLLNNIGVVYRNQGNYLQALNYFERAKDTEINDDLSAYKAMVKDNIGFTKFLLGNYDVKPDLLNAYQMRKEANSQIGMAVSLLHLAEFEYVVGNPNDSKNYAFESLNIAQKVGDKKNQLKALRFLLSNWTDENLIETYIVLDSKLDSTKESLEHKFALIDYQSQKRENENLVLKSENARQQQNIAKSKVQTVILIASVFILSILLIGALIYLKQRRKFNRKKLIIETLKEREAERDRISFHIHEEVGSLLYIALQKGQTGIDQKSNQEIDEIFEHVDSAYQMLRKISQELDTPDFSRTSFKQHIRYLIAEYSFEGGPSVSLNNLSLVKVNHVEQLVKREILSILKEVFTNIRKHSGATEVELSLITNRNNINVEVMDNGKGFENVRKAGVGIEHIRKRITKLGGELMINSSKDSGTHVKFEIPVSQ